MTEGTVQAPCFAIFNMSIHEFVVTGMDFQDQDKFTLDDS